VTKRLIPILLPFILLCLAGCGQSQTATAPTPSAPAKKTTEVAPAPPAPTPGYTLTELQRAHLHEGQLQFFLASKDLQKALDQFDQTCAQVKAENKWSAGTRCNIQDLSIVPPGVQPAAPVMQPAQVIPAAPASEPKK
jgi:hypothetical protein